MIPNERTALKDFIIANLDYKIKTSFKDEVVINMQLDDLKVGFYIEDILEEICNHYVSLGWFPIYYIWFSFISRGCIQLHTNDFDKTRWVLDGNEYKEIKIKHKEQGCKTREELIMNKHNYNKRIEELRSNTNRKESIIKKIFNL